IREAKTKAPAFYTEASLVKALEDHGIGRPSTYASIMSNIKRRGYVAAAKAGSGADKSMTIKATALGCRLVDAMRGGFSFVELDYTAAMEARLDEIAGGTAKYSDVVGSTNETLD